MTHWSEEEYLPKQRCLGAMGTALGSRSSKRTRKIGCRYQWILSGSLSLSLSLSLCVCVCVCVCVRARMSVCVCVCPPPRCASVRACVPASVDVLPKATSDFAGNFSYLQLYLQDIWLLTHSFLSSPYEHAELLAHFGFACVRARMFRGTGDRSM